MLVKISYVLKRNELYDGHREDARTRKIKNMKRMPKKTSYYVRSEGCASGQEITHR
jgi:hypothetical protein